MGPRARAERVLREVLAWRLRLAEFPQLVNESPSLRALSETMQRAERGAVDELRELGVRVTLELPAWPHTMRAAPKCGVEG
jgi:hypothetical protein